MALTLRGKQQATPSQANCDTLCGMPGRTSPTAWLKVLHDIAQDHRRLQAAGLPLLAPPTTPHPAFPAAPAGHSTAQNLGQQPA
jgi:hypothetical protein